MEHRTQQLMFSSITAVGSMEAGVQAGATRKPWRIPPTSGIAMIRPKGVVPKYIGADEKGSRTYAGVSTEFLRTRAQVIGYRLEESPKRGQLTKLAGQYPAKCAANS